MTDGIQDGGQRTFDAYEASRLCVQKSWLQSQHAEFKSFYLVSFV